MPWGLDEKWPTTKDGFIWPEVTEGGVNDGYSRTRAIEKVVASDEGLTRSSHRYL